MSVVLQGEGMLCPGQRCLEVARRCVNRVDRRVIGGGAAPAGHVALVDNAAFAHHLEAPQAVRDNGGRRREELLRELLGEGARRQAQQLGFSGLCGLDGYDEGRLVWLSAPGFVTAHLATA